jgi:hypothetical protein
MIENIQYKFKPTETSPGFHDGQEMCIHRGLTEYCAELRVPCFVVQLWEGADKEAHVVGYAIINKDTKQLVFTDRRHDVCEYIIENIANQMMRQVDEEEGSQAETE